METRVKYKWIATRIAPQRDWFNIGVDVMGRSGGLLLLWKKGINFQIYSLNPNWIGGNPSWSCVFLHGEPNQNQLPQFWCGFIDLITAIFEPVVCLGDWNLLWSNKEKVGCNIPRPNEI